MTIPLEDLKVGDVLREAWGDYVYEYEVAKVSHNPIDGKLYADLTYYSYINNTSGVSAKFQEGATNSVQESSPNCTICYDETDRWVIVRPEPTNTNCEIVVEPKDVQEGDILNYVVIHGGSLKKTDTYLISKVHKIERTHIIIDITYYSYLKNYYDSKTNDPDITCSYFYIDGETSGEAQVAKNYHILLPMGTYWQITRKLTSEPVIRPIQPFQVDDTVYLTASGENSLILKVEKIFYHNNNWQMCVAGITVMCKDFTKIIKTVERVWD